MSELPGEVGAIGPVDLVVVKFPGNNFRGEIAPALLDLVQDGTIRVLDALFVYRDADGSVGSLEVGDLGPDMAPAFVEVRGRVGAGVLDTEDATDVAEDLAVNSSALLLVFENTWAARLVAAMRRADGEVVDMARIPAAAVESALQQAAERPIEA
jgi:uncharacterized membrane protein